MYPTRDKLIELLAYQLYKHDTEHFDLVNFVDDEIDWDKIATVVVDYLSENKLLELEDE